MKNLFFALFCLCLFTACADDEDPFVPQLPCEIIGEEIIELIRTEGLTTTRLEASGIVSTPINETPTVDGCTLEFRNTFYNLELLVSYRAIENTLMLNFL